MVLGAHGKLKAWMTKRLLDVKDIKILVFDEADEMLKADAFADDSLRMINTIRKQAPQACAAAALACMHAVFLSCFQPFSHANLAPSRRSAARKLARSA